MQNLDTHKLVEELIAEGISKKQAEPFVEVIAYAINSDLKIAIRGQKTDIKWLMAIGIAISIGVAKLAFF